MKHGPAGDRRARAHLAICNRKPDTSARSCCPRTSRSSSETLHPECHELSGVPARYPGKCSAWAELVNISPSKTRADSRKSEF